ncbi:MAG: nuclear transport factor 2 family protein [Bacteroidota bacterium]
MKHTQQQIATLFSNGDFEETFPYLSADVIWNVVGENQFQGKPAVVNNCQQTLAYFKSVETKFITEDVIVAENRVVIRGSGEFIREGKRVNFILACDVYEFSDEGKLEKITSYCIPES